MKKEIRIKTLLEIITRWGKLDKEKIFNLFSSSTNTSLSPALERALYRDLTELVNRNELSVEYYTRDGVLLNNFDESLHKNYFCKWFIAEAEGKILGGGILNSVNSYLYCPKLLCDEVSITTGTDTNSLKSICIFFNIGGKFLSIRISKESLPVSLIISRTKSKIEENEVFKIRNELGQRCLILKVPFPKVSSFSDKRLGNTLITFKDENLIYIKDLKSTNGTSYQKLSKDEAESLRHMWGEAIKETVEVDWENLVVDDFDIIDEIEISPSCAIKIADQFNILVF